MKKSNRIGRLIFSVILFFPLITTAHPSVNTNEGAKSYIIALVIVLGLLLIPLVIGRIKKKIKTQKSNNE